MYIVVLILLPTVGLVTWAWFSVAQVERELRFFSGFEGMHFDLTPHTAYGTTAPGDGHAVVIYPAVGGGGRPESMLREHGRAERTHDA